MKGRHGAAFTGLGTAAEDDFLSRCTFQVPAGGRARKLAATLQAPRAVPSAPWETVRFCSSSFLLAMSCGPKWKHPLGTATDPHQGTGVLCLISATLPAHLP